MCVCVCAGTGARALKCMFVHVQITVIIKNRQLEFIIASVCSTILLFNDYLKFNFIICSSNVMILL